MTYNLKHIFKIIKIVLEKRVLLIRKKTNLEATQA